MKRNSEIYRGPTHPLVPIFPPASPPAMPLGPWQLTRGLGHFGGMAEAVCGRLCKQGAGALTCLMCQPLMHTPEDRMAQLLLGQQGAVPNSLPSSPPSPPSYL